jgi:hypothetical protein
MKNTTLAALTTLSLLSGAAHARLTGFDTTSALEKEALGYTAQLLDVTVKPSYDNAADIVASFGRDGRGFKLLINGVLLFPKKGDERRAEAKVKIGAFGVALSPEVSLDVYNELAVDFTPKKIAEGVTSGDSVFKCSEPTSCQLLDERGSFWMFDGNRAQGSGNQFRSYKYGHHNYETINFTGKVTNTDGSLTKSFTKAFKKQILEMAPDTIKYFQVSNSKPDNSKTYEEHKRLAIVDMENDFGKSELERKVLKRILIGKNITFKEKIKRSSRSGCTYFCGASGRFVEASVTAKTDF